MAKVTPEMIERAKKMQSTVLQDENGFFYQTDYPDDKYEFRKEAWFAAIEKNEQKRLAKEGKNYQMQTPQQVKDFEARKKIAEDRKKKAALAAEMAYQNK